MFLFLLFTLGTPASLGQWGIKEIIFKGDTVRSIFHMFFYTGLYWGNHTWNNSRKIMRYRILELFLYPVVSVRGTHL